MTAPRWLEPDPAVAHWAVRWPSTRDPRVTYDCALMVGEGGPAYMECSCAGFSFRDACKHVAWTMALVRAEQRQAVLDARLGCRHPLTVDEEELLPDEYEQPAAVWRTCVACGEAYDRLAVLARLREDIRARRRLPPSPWTAEERSHDPA
jgi:hypothetical protein